MKLSSLIIHFELYKSYNYFSSYLAYRDNEIKNYIQNNSDINDIKGIFESKFNQKDDWIKLLNIENIMFLSSLNYDDLDLESDPKYELLRDSILEKVIMLTVSYYCLSKELRYLVKLFRLSTPTAISIIGLADKPSTEVDPICSIESATLSNNFSKFSFSHNLYPASFEATHCL